jgi:Rrf2 family iron-sulfur cluster assembly transcriptional regulator
LWDGLSAQIEEFLSGVSLQDLIDRQSVQTVSIRQDQIMVQREANGFAEASNG